MIKKRIVAFLTAISFTATSFIVMASANNPADGLKILDGTFEGSEYYIKDAPLGIANQFHLFAFDSITLNAHCNGNFAAPVVDAHQASGTNQFSDTGTFPEQAREISIATKKIDIEGSTKVTDLLIPEGQLVTNANGEFGVTNPINGQIKIDGKLVDMNNSSDRCVYHVTEDYLDFAEYQKQYAEISNALAEANPTIEAKIENGRYSVVLEETGTNVLNLKGDDIVSNEALNGFDIHGAQYTKDVGYTGEQSLLINVDLAGYDSIESKAKVTIFCTDGTYIYSREENVLDGTIVLWNYYDSSSADGQFHGDIKYGAVCLGSILAPYAAITTEQNVDGNIIANTIYTGAESHRCDFMGPLNTTTSETTPAETTTPETTPAETTTPETTPAETTTPVTTPAETTTPVTTPAETTTPVTTPAETSAPVTTPAETTTPKTTPAETTTPKTTPAETTTPKTTPAETTTPKTTPAETSAPVTTPDETTTPKTTPAETTTPKTTPAETSAPETTPAVATTTEDTGDIGGIGDDNTATTTAPASDPADDPSDPTTTTDESGDVGGATGSGDEDPAVTTAVTTTAAAADPSNDPDKPATTTDENGEVGGATDDDGDIGSGANDKSGDDDGGSGNGSGDGNGDDDGDIGGGNDGSGDIGSGKDNPITGEAAPIALAVALIIAAGAITLTKKSEKKLR